MTRLTVMLAAFLAALIGVFFLAAVTHRGGPPLFIIHHDVEIDAPADSVWAILNDAAAHPTWNPYVLEIDGVLQPGETLRVRIAQDDWSQPRDVTARVMRAGDSELRWRGTVGIEGVFDTEHSFQVVSLEAGRSRFVQREEFRGWLAALLRARRPEEDPVLPGTARAFEAMNLALKERAEVLREQEKGSP